MYSQVTFVYDNVAFFCSITANQCFQFISSCSGRRYTSWLQLEINRNETLEEERSICDSHLSASCSEKPFPGDQNTYSELKRFKLI